MGVFSQSILDADNAIKDQGSAVDTHGPDGLPVVPTRVEVLVLDPVEHFEVVG